MALTRKQYRQKVLDTYGLPDELPDWVSARWINTHINRGLREVSELTECIQGSCGFSAAASTRTYSVTTDFLRVDRVEADTGSASLTPRELTVTTRDEVADDNGATWRGATGILSKWYIEDQRLIAFAPIPVTAGSSIYLYGPRYAAELSTEGSSGEIATALDDAVVDYVCRELGAIDPKGERKEVRFGAQYGRDIMKYRKVRPMVVGMKLMAPRG